MINKNNRGKFCILLSAFIYGFVPILARLAYSGGVNGITLTFLRAVMMIPLLAFALKISNIPIGLSPDELRKIIILGVVGGTLPIMLLYVSYDYINAGLAATLHFIYPMIITFAAAIIYRERMTRVKLLALMFVMLGISLSANTGHGGSKTGIVLALLSGILYSFYVIYMDRSGLDGMNYVKLTFYLMLTMSASTMIFGLALDKIDFEMTGGSWGLAFIISALITAVAIPAFQVGVKAEGAATAGILSALEPVTTTVCSMIFLNEYMGVSELIGTAVMLTGIVLAEKSG